MNEEVVAIDADKSRVQAIDPHASEALVLDATDKESLKSLGLEHMDGVIVSTGTKISTVASGWGVISAAGVICATFFHQVPRQ